MVGWTLYVRVRINLTKKRIHHVTGSKISDVKLYYKNPNLQYKNYHTFDVV